MHRNYIELNTVLNLRKLARQYANMKSGLNDMSQFVFDMEATSTKVDSSRIKEIMYDCDKIIDGSDMSIAILNEMEREVLAYRKNIAGLKAQEQ